MNDPRRSSAKKESRGWWCGHHFLRAPPLCDLCMLALFASQAPGPGVPDGVNVCACVRFLRRRPLALACLTVYMVHHAWCYLFHVSAFSLVGQLRIRRAELLNYRELCVCSPPALLALLGPRVRGSSPLPVCRLGGSGGCGHWLSGASASSFARSG